MPSLSAVGSAFLDESDRGRGVGRALAGEIFSIARARLLQKLLVRMASGQMGALRLFYSLGFCNQAILTGCVKNENGVTENLVIMSRDFGERWSS